MTKVLGLDVSKSSVSACLLVEKPQDPRQFYYSFKFHLFPASKSGLESLLALKPDVAVMEPTGTNYSKIWREHLTKAGIKVLLVGHQQLRNYRAHHLALPDKDDNADSLALACYWFDYWNNPKRFAKSPGSPRIRELVLRLEHLNRIQSPILNRLRQDLAWQFPEVASVRSTRGKQGKPPLLWAWIAGIRESSRYDKLYQKSIGLGLEQSTRDRSAIFCNLQNQEYQAEVELRSLLASQCFHLYFQVFEKFNFGFRLSAILIAYIYPIEQFLVDGKPEVKIYKGRTSGKPTKRYLSLRRFQKTLGLAPSLEASGDKKGVKANNGSKLCRKAIWLWVFSTLEPKKKRSGILQIQSLCNYLDVEKANGKPARLVRLRVAAKAVKLLFKELVHANKLLE
ncbi:MAG: IS110 family transposase [Calothrix sp. MO_167.B42]|nr:IS110 family transposase [Calothrix sp. MO_167.B42]